MTGYFPLSVRNAFKNLPQEPSHIATQAPRWAEVFTPNGHEGALDPHRTIVVGDRGTGKSFWSSVLINPAIRNLVAKRYPRLSLDRVEAALGFSDAEMAADHPSASEIQAIIDAGYRPEDLWRAVFLDRTRFRPLSMPTTACGWKEAVAWVAADPARRSAEFRGLDERLNEDGKIYVLVFDALDVIADKWTSIRAQLEGLIKLALALRALRSVRIKLFIRHDMADDRRLWEVGDASKLFHSNVPLTWKRLDLYGLLWTHLANAGDSEEAAIGGNAFRSHCSSAFRAEFDYQDGSWRPPRELVENESRQQEIFRALAGDYMGINPRKGDTYKWVPNHLSDAAGLAAPRSFVLAMQRAAANAKASETVLDKFGIVSGTRFASSIRVQELSEDYRWMNKVLEAMDKLVVPLSLQDLYSRWTERGTLGALKALSRNEGEDRRFIPPGEVLEATDEAEAYSKLVDQMIRLKIFFRLSDGRVNLPDLFRLQANVKRKGGMKPRG